MFRRSREIWTSLRKSVAFRCQYPQSRRPKKTRSSQVSGSVERLEDRTLLAAAIDPAWERLAPEGSLVFQRDYEGDLLQTVYAEDFETGPLGGEWTTNSSTPNGRIVVSNTLGAPAHSG